MPRAEREIIRFKPTPKPVVVSADDDPSRPGARRRPFTPFEGVTVGAKSATLRGHSHAGTMGSACATPNISSGSVARPAERTAQKPRVRLTAALGSYEGEVNAVGDGRGRYFLDEGDMYEGTWEAGKFSGRGSYHFKNGDIYTGDFKLGQPDGVGTLRWADGELEVGTCRRGSRVGVGVRWSADRRRAIRLLGGEEQRELELEEAQSWLEMIGLKPSVLDPPPHRQHDNLGLLGARRQLHDPLKLLS